jgi:hypothetical protein
MHRTWLARANALVLALLLAGGGSGLPIFDALFHHLGATRTLSHACVERADVESPHAERCTLSAALPALAAAGALPDGRGIGADPVAQPVHPFTGLAHAAPRSRSTLPRAPPVSIA